MPLTMLVEARQPTDSTVAGQREGVRGGTVGQQKGGARGWCGVGGGCCGQTEGVERWRQWCLCCQPTNPRTP